MIPRASCSQPALKFITFFTSTSAIVERVKGRKETENKFFTRWHECVLIRFRPLRKATFVDRHPVSRMLNFTKDLNRQNTSKIKVNA